MNNKRLNSNQKEVLRALEELGGTATVRQIAEKVDRSVNGVSQTLGSLFGCIEYLGGRGGEAKYQLHQVETEQIPLEFGK